MVAGKWPGSMALGWGIAIALTGVATAIGVQLLRSGGLGPSHPASVTAPSPVHHPWPPPLPIRRFPLAEEGGSQTLGEGGATQGREPEIGVSGSAVSGDEPTTAAPAPAVPLGPAATTSALPPPLPQGTALGNEGTPRPTTATPESSPSDLTHLLTPAAPPRPFVPLPTPAAGVSGLDATGSDRLATAPPHTWVATAPRLPAAILDSPQETRPSPAIAQGETAPPRLPQSVPPNFPAIPPQPGLPAPTLPPLRPPSSPILPPTAPSTAPAIVPPAAPLDATPASPPPSDPPVPSEPTPPSLPGIFVAQLQVLGTTVFAPQRLAQQVWEALGLSPTSAQPAPQHQGDTVFIPINRTLSLGELVQAGEAITQLYLDQGYINSGAVVLADSAESARPVIQVVEGRLESTTLTWVTPTPRVQIQRIPEAIRSPAPIPWQPIGHLPEGQSVAVAPPDRQTEYGNAATLEPGPDLVIGLATGAVPSPYAVLGQESPQWIEVPVPSPPSLAEGTPAVLGTEPLPGEAAARGRWLAFTGPRPLDPGYLGARLQLSGGQPFNVNQLLAGVQLLQLNPLIEQIGTEITAGSQTGTSRLRIQAIPRRSDRLQVSYDNSRSLTSGDMRQGLLFTQENLLGWGDRLQLSYGRTQGSEDWDLAYQVPLSPYDTTLRLTLGGTRNRIITDIFSVLDLISATENASLTLRQPFWQTPSGEAAISFSLAHTLSRTTFLGGLPFPTPGANREGITRITTFRFGQEWLQRESTQVIALQSEFSLGLDSLGATRDPDPSIGDSQFLRWQGRGQWARLLGPDFLLLVRGAVQWSDRPLPSVEQWSVGGSSTVRGYRQNRLVGDGGWYTAAELQIPVFRIPEVGGVFQIAPFFDQGGSWNAPQRDDSRLGGTLSSVGVGVLWSQGSTLRARLDWGIPLTPSGATTSALQDSGIHFSIQFSPQF